MLNKIRNRQGFTLIELLIVVAIIGILAAIAIPQFSAYRQKGFNSSAGADIKNAKTVQESMFADFQTYGRTQAAALLTAAADTTGGAGIILQGPIVASTATVVGGLLSGPRPDPSNNPPNAAIASGAGVSLSNGVHLQSDNMAVDAVSFTSNSYVMMAKNVQGTRVFFTETEATAIMFTQNDAEAGTTLATSAAYGVLPAPTAVIDLAAGAATGNPAPYDKWAAL